MDLNISGKNGCHVSQFMTNMTLPGTYIESKVALIIGKWVFPLIILLGTVGNSLTLIVLTRKAMRTTSVYVYLFVLACADMGVLYISAFKTWIVFISEFKYQLLLVSDEACKIVIFLFLINIHMSAWLIVAVSLDRFLVVWSPLKAGLICTVRRAKLISALLFAMIVIVNAHNLFTLHLQKPGGTCYCGPLKEDVFIKHYYPWIKLTTYSITPFLIVLVLNTAIVGHLWCRASHTSSSGPTNPQQFTREKRLTYMLMLVSFSWLFLSAPFTLYHFLADRSTEDEYERSKNTLAKIICFLLMYINHAINFFLYHISGKKFRRNFQEMMACCSLRTITTSLEKKITHKSNPQDHQMRRIYWNQSDYQMPDPQREVQV